MQKNLGSKIEQVGGNWEALSNKAMSGSAGVTGSFLDMTNSALSWAGSSNSSMAQFSRQMLGLAPAIGTGVTALGTFITNASRIGGAISGTISVMSTIGSTVSAAVGVAQGSKAAASALSFMAKESKIAAAAQAVLNTVMKANPFV